MGNHKERMAEDKKQFEWDMDNGGSFKKSLIDSMMRADSNNIQKLYKGFPDLVNGYVAYSHNMDWDTFLGTVRGMGLDIID